MQSKMQNINNNMEKHGNNENTCNNKMQRYAKDATDAKIQRHVKHMQPMTWQTINAKSANKHVIKRVKYI